MNVNDACTPSPTSSTHHRKRQEEKEDDMPDNPGGDGWDEYRRHVIAELTRLADGQADAAKEMVQLRKDFSQLCADVAVNKAKIAMIGAISGLVAGGIMSIILMLIERSLP